MKMGKETTIYLNGIPVKAEIIELSKDILDETRPTQEELDMWCQCEEHHGVDFMDDGECDCGVHKHHYHCQKCGKITQIG